VPYWAVCAGITLGALGSILVGALAKDPGIAKTFQTGVTPILTLFAGGLFNDLYHRLGEDKHLAGDVRKSADATLIMLQNVITVEARLTEASDALNEGRQGKAATSIAVALAMTTATLRQVRQNLRLWRSLSPKAVDDARQEFEEDETTIEPVRQQQIALPGDEDRKVGDGNG
jgi:hypothetical protein